MKQKMYYQMQFCLGICLSEGGVMIFDDYEWEKLSKDYFCPKIAIDSFVHIYKPQIDVLYIGYQFIIKKKESKFFEKPESDKIYKLIRDITYFNFYNLNVLYDLKITLNLKYSIVMRPEIPDYINDNVSENLKSIIKYHNNCKNIKKYNFYHLFYVDKPFEIIKNTIDKNLKFPIEIKNIFSNYEYFDFFKSNSYLYSIIKYINNQTNSDVCLFSRDVINPYMIKNKILKLYNKNINLDVFTISDDKHNFNDLYTIKFTNFNDLSNIIKLTKNKKYDKLHFRTMIKKTKDGIMRNLKTKFVLVIENLFRIFLCLSLQKKGGSVVFNFNFELSNIFFEFLLILKKYYERVVIKNQIFNECSTVTLVVECIDFNGITKNELDELENIVKKVSSKNNDWINYPRDDYLFLHSILEYNDDVKKHLDFIKTIFIDEYNKLIGNSLEHLKLLMDIKNTIDLEHDKHKNKIYHLENVIYKKQISEFVYALNVILDSTKK